MPGSIPGSIPGGAPEGWDLSASMLAFEHASTLPAACYTAPAFFEREVEAIFRREWLCVGRVDQVAAPGDYFCVDMVGEPLVVLRDAEGGLRVLSRVCRHRSMAVVEGAGSARSFVCPYHNWTYALDGRLVGAPEMGRTPGFDASGICLPTVRHEVWQGFIMVNFDDGAAPFGPRLGTLSALIANWRMDEMTSVATFELDYPWNWKVMIDNYIECYHHPTIHRESLEPGMPGRSTYFEPDEGPYSVMQMPYREGHGPAVPGRPVEGPRLPVLESLTGAERGRGAILQVFPTLLFAIYPDHTDYYRVFPEGPARVRLTKTFCATTEQMWAPGAEAAMKRIVDYYHYYAPEDLEVCRGLQRGMTSRLSAPGRYSHMEEGVWKFGKYVAERVTGAAQPP